MCSHEKVYSDIMLPTLPAKYLWKCRKCGKEGYDIKQDDPALRRVQEEFDIIQAQ